ncbi:hypothetical protein Tco_0426758 [Tanacetum coccineum]
MRRVKASPFGDAMEETCLPLHDICSWISSVPFLRPRCPRCRLRMSLLFCDACADCPRSPNLEGFHSGSAIIQACCGHRDCPAYPGR